MIILIGWWDNMPGPESWSHHDVFLSIHMCDGLSFFSLLAAEHDNLSRSYNTYDLISRSEMPT
jgi:hypothetical protein